MNAARVDNEFRPIVSVPEAAAYFDLIDNNSGNATIWTSIGQEKFELIDEGNGEVQYTGLEDTVVNITFSMTAKAVPAGGGNLIHTAIFHDTGSGFNLVENSKSYSQASGMNVALASRTLTLPISPGDKLKIRTQNDAAINDIQWLTLSYTISGLGL